MYITGVVLGDNAIGQGRGGVAVAFPVQQTGGVINIPGGDARMASMPPQGVDAQPGSHQDSDLLLVPLEVTPVPPQSVVQETGPPPPYHEISTCTTGGPSSRAEGDPPPPYTEDEQVSLKYKLYYVLV